MVERLLSPTFLFRFAVPCRRLEGPLRLRDMALSDAHVLPSFGELEGRSLFADLRLAWSEEGLAVTCRVVGKSQPPWCRSSLVEESDGLQLFIDTRDAHNIHRATRFCHRFAFLPTGSGRGLNLPTAALISIHRARENPKPVRGKQLPIESSKHSTGYELRAFIPAGSLTGYDPVDHPRLGFSYAVADRELGWQTFSMGPEFPFVEDPSLWGTLELT